MAKIKVGDAEFEVNDAVASVYADKQKQVDSLNLKVKDMEEEKEKTDAEIAKAKEDAEKEKEKTDAKLGASEGEKETLKKENEELKKSGDSETIHKMATDRAILLGHVTELTGDADLSTMTDTEIQILALSKATDMDMKDKSASYVAGVFDTMVASKANDSLTAFGKELTNDSVQKVSARDAYTKKLLGGKE